MVLLYVKYAVMRFSFGNLTLALFCVSGKIPPEEIHSVHSHSHLYHRHPLTLTHKTYNLNDLVALGPVEYGHSSLLDSWFHSLHSQPSFSAGTQNQGGSPDESRQESPTFIT